MTGCSPSLCLERAGLPAATDPGLALRWGRGPVPAVSPAVTHMHGFSWAPSPDLLASQLTDTSGEALLSHNPGATSTWPECEGNWVLSPVIEESILAQLYSGIFRFAPAMQWEQPRIHKPCAPLAGEVFRPLWMWWAAESLGSIFWKGSLQLCLHPLQVKPSFHLARGHLWWNENCRNFLS